MATKQELYVRIDDCLDDDAPVAKREKDVYLLDDASWIDTNLPAKFLQNRSGVDSVGLSSWNLGSWSPSGRWSPSRRFAGKWASSPWLAMQEGLLEPFGDEVFGPFSCSPLWQVLVALLVGFFLCLGALQMVPDGVSQFVCSVSVDLAYQYIDKAPGLGIIQIDYVGDDHVGDIGTPATFAEAFRKDARVVYKRVKGWTFEDSQHGTFGRHPVLRSLKQQAEIRDAFIATVKQFDADPSIQVIGCNVGFGMNYQDFVKQYTKKPVIMSSLMMLNSFWFVALKDPRTPPRVAVVTANASTLDRYMLRNPSTRRLLGMPEQGSLDNVLAVIDLGPTCYGQNVAKGVHFDRDQCYPEIEQTIERTLNNQTSIHFLIMESTELGYFSNALRFKFELPVLDAVYAYLEALQAFDGGNNIGTGIYGR